MKITIINKILLVLMLITAQQVSALEFQVDGIYYRTSIFTKNSAYVTHSGTSYTESVEYQGAVVIPESVTYNGKTYTIASIGGYAFAGCPGLTSVTIPSSVTMINQYAFDGCTGLKTIECKASTPPALGDNAFTSYDATLVVPTASESVYKSAAGWGKFKFEEEPSETPGSGENSGEDNTGGGSDSGEDNGSDNGGDSGSSTVPEACYLVGNYNAWYTPTEENVDELYTLTDPDKDGVYYGKFYFDKGQFFFKIFITIGGWESGNYFGTDRKITMDNITGFFSVSYEGSAYNFECSDWNGGYVEIFFDFKNNTIRFLFPNENPTLSYNIISETKVEVIAGTEKYTGDIVIPSLVTISGKTYKITQIATRAFDGCTDLTSITIPNSVTSIESSAFYGCSGLTSITIPEGVTSIGDDAFRGCTGLTSITIPNSVKTIGEGAFEECTGLTKVNIFDLEAWCKIYFYYSYANPLNYAKNLYLNGELLTNLEIPNSITEIKQYAFKGCSGLTSITIPNSVTSIGSSAFKDCSGLTSITIPNSVTSIGSFAFQGCSGLTSITIPNSVTSIGESAFSGCSGLTSITIPNSVTSIGYSAFSGCTGLTSITIPEGVTSIGKSAFYRCSGLISVTIPNSVTGIGEDAFAYCSGLTSITIPEGVTSIGIAAFNGCNRLTSVTIPNSVTSIGSFAFQGCSGLTSITIPDGVTSIWNYTFRDCSGLTSITIPEGITSIGAYAFKDCSGLTSITIPNSVTSIGELAFYGCSGLTSVTIPEGVTSIGELAFYGCSGLTSVIFNAWNCGTMGSSNNPVFYNCTQLSSVTIGNNVKNIPTYAFQGCSGLTSITIPNSVTSIGAAAFQGCSGLTSITIPNSVTSIGDNVFSGCSSLISVTIGSSVTGIGESAFADCTGLTSVTSLNTTPPTCGTSVFNNVSVGNITLEVPAESVSLYQIADTWKDFGTIKGIGESSALTYNILNETDVEVVAGTEKYTGDIVIPSQTTIDGKVYNVTSIGNTAFDGCTGLTSVTIPNSVTSIGDLAFNCCSGLTSITIPSSVTSIGDYAFSQCTGLTSVTIPSSVISLGRAPFCDCYFINSFVVESGNTKYDSRENCNAIIETSTNSLIQGCENTVIPNSVTGIGEEAFAGCNSLTSITIPNSVTSIGNSAFSFCSLTSIIIPSSVTSIAGGIFYYCYGLTSIIVASGNTIYDSRDNCNAIIETSTNKLITGCENTVIPNSVTGIGDNAFSGCSGLTSISIPSSVTSIGNYAFYCCNRLTSIISLNPTPPTCGRSVFYNVSVGNITLEVPSESVSLYQSADTWKDLGSIKAYSSASRSESSGIDDILADGDEVEYYNLQGVRVMNPSKGLYIKREGGKTSKVVL